MVDLFSADFLDQLKTEVNAKVKPSKAMLNAIRELSLLNEQNKKKINEQNQYIEDLKQENSLLIQLLDTAKIDYFASLQSKQEKMKKMIQKQAKLLSQNQFLQRKIMNYETQLAIYKEMALKLKSNSEIGSRQDIRLSAISLSKRTNKQSLSEFDLEAYLTQERKNIKTSRCQTNKSIEENMEQQYYTTDNKCSLQHKNEVKSMKTSDIVQFKNQKNQDDNSQMNESLLGHLLNDNN